MVWYAACLARCVLLISPKEVLVLIGRSGSGKSTMMRCINFLEEPSSGMITGCRPIDAVAAGLRPDQNTAVSMRLHTGMVFQEFNLFPHMTALDNVIEGLVTVKKMSKDQAIAIGKKYLEKVGLEERGLHIPSAFPAGRNSAWPSPAPWRWNPR